MKKIFILILLIVAVAMPQDRRRVGLIPFQNEGNQSRYDWVSYGFEYLLHNKLSVISSFFIPDKSTFDEVLQRADFGSEPLDQRMIYHIGKYANVEVTISGNYTVKGNILNLKVTYSNALKGEPLITTNYNEPLSNLFDINTKIVNELINLAGIGLTSNENRLLNLRITNSISAFENFIKAYIENEKRDGRIEKVTSLFRRAIREDPKFWEAYYNLGIVYFNNNQYSLALEQFNKVIEALPKFDKAYYGRGLIYENKKQYQKAIEDFKTVIEFNPNDYKTYHRLGKLYRAAENYEQAVKQLEKAKDLNPNHAPIHYQLGNVYYDQDKYRQSIDHYRKAVKLDNDNPDYHLKLGDVYYRSQIYYSAINEIKTVLSIRPNDAIANFLFGITIYKQAVLEELVDAFLDILNPSNPENSQRNNEDREFNKDTGIDPVAKRQVYLDMAESFKKAIEARPNFLEASFNLALTYHEMGEYENAERYYKATIQINSEVPRVYIKLAELYTDMGEKDKAIDTYHRLFYIDPAYFVHKPTLGKEHQYINIFERFKSELVEKVQEDPNNPNNNLILAKIFKARGNFGKAANLLRKVLALTPNNDEAKNLLNQLQAQRR